MKLANSAMAYGDGMMVYANDFSKETGAVSKMPKMRWVGAAVVVGVLSMASMAFGADRQTAVQKSMALQDRATELANLAQFQCHCPNTAEKLYDIAEIGVDVELAARFGSTTEASASLRKVVKKVIEMRQFLANIQDRAIRMEIKREIALAVNELGKAVMEQNWIFISAAAAENGDPASEEQVLEIELNEAAANLETIPASEF